VGGERLQMWNCIWVLLAATFSYLESQTTCQANYQDGDDGYKPTSIAFSLEDRTHKKIQHLVNYGFSDERLGGNFGTYFLRYFVGIKQLKLE
jgi:hypothetical protein